MIIVRVELQSARTGKTTELARMHVTNTGGVGCNGARRNYAVATFRGRSREQLDALKVQRKGRLDGFPSPRFHVWHLILYALAAAGYAIDVNKPGAKTQPLDTSI